MRYLDRDNIHKIHDTSGILSPKLKTDLQKD